MCPQPCWVSFLQPDCEVPRESLSTGWSGADMVSVEKRVSPTEKMEVSWPGADQEIPARSSPISFYRSGNQEKVDVLS